MKNKLDILETDYILEHGTLFDEDVFSYECYSENGKSYYEQLFDKPRNKGGKPFSGLLYEIYPSGELREYHYYKDGFEYGDDVSFYKNGQISRYTCFENGTFISNSYEWYENGQLRSVYERYRKDNPSFFRKTEYDENGSKNVKSISCEVKFSYNYRRPDDNCNCEVLWHTNGEFKKIIWKKPNREIFYKSAEFDEEGYPIDFEINSIYNPKYLSIVNNKENLNVKRFDDNFRFSVDMLLCKRSGNEFRPFTGKISFFYLTGEIQKICEYKDGSPFSTQLAYYKSGQIAEKYNIESGKLFNKYFKWYENGRLKEVIEYNKEGLQKRITQFLADGNIIKQSEV